MLDSLLRVLKKHGRIIEAHRDALNSVETRTRMALIDPLLTVLGWDASDPALVMPEYKTREGMVDYALMKDDGKPWAFLEAKRLDESLEKHVSQIINYALTEGVSIAGLTDGDRWRIYDVFKPVPLHEKCILDISISDHTPYQCALKLLFLWRADLTASSSAKVAIPPAFPFHGQENASRQNQKARSRIQTPVQHEPPLPSDDWVSLTKYEVRLGASPPSAILFPDQRQVTISRWKQLLTSTVEWLLRATEFQLPADPQNPTKFFVNTEPKSPRGSFYKHPHIFKHKGMNIYVNTWKSAKNLKRHTIEILEAGAIDPKDVYVKR